MNELYVDNCWIYFKTKENICVEAVEKLKRVCEDVGIEITIEGAVLRDEDGNDMEWY